MQIRKNIGLFKLKILGRCIGESFVGDMFLHIAPLIDRFEKFVERVEQIPGLSDKLRLSGIDKILDEGYVEDKGFN